MKIVPSLIPLLAISFVSFGGDSEFTDLFQTASRLVQAFYPEIAAEKCVTISIQTESVAINQIPLSALVHLRNPSNGSGRDIVQFWISAEGGVVLFFLRVDKPHLVGGLDPIQRIQTGCQRLAKLVNAERFRFLKKEKGKILFLFELKNPRSFQFKEATATFDNRTGQLLNFSSPIPEPSTRKGGFTDCQ